MQGQTVILCHCYFFFIKPPYNSRKVYILPLLFIYFFFFLSFFRQLPSALSEQKSTKLCHILGRERDLQIHVQNLQKLVVPKQLILDVYRRRRDWIANIFQIKRDKDNQTTKLETTKGPRQSLKFYEILSTNS